VGETAVERQPVKLEAGQSMVVEFKRRNLKEGQYQAEITLVPSDALPSDNIRFVTFEVRGARKTLVISDEEEYALFWRTALDVFGEFGCDFKTPEKIAAPEDLKPYLAVVLLSVRAPGELWPKLNQYVKAGGSVLVIVGRDDLLKPDYVGPEAGGLLPGKLDQVIDMPDGKGAEWDTREFNKHPLLAKFMDWDRQGVGFMRRPRQAYHFWAVKTDQPRDVILSYSGEKKYPAILERVIDREKGSGRVLMFTTALDYRPNDKDWNDYAKTLDEGFLVALANETMKYLAGDMEDASFNFVSGQPLALPLPQTARFPDFTLDGPGIVGGDSRLLRKEGQTDLAIAQTDTAGNFVVAGGGTPPIWKTRYSLNPPPNEFALERIPAEEIEKLFGPDSVVPVEQNRKMTDIVTNRTRQPIELFAWLMVLFMLFLGVECWFANRFYKEEPPPNTEPLAA